MGYNDRKNQNTFERGGTCPRRCLVNTLVFRKNHGHSVGKEPDRTFQYICHETSRIGLRYQLITLDHERSFGNCDGRRPMKRQLTYRGRPLEERPNIIYQLMEDQSLLRSFCFGSVPTIGVSRGLRIGRTVGMARTVLRPDLATSRGLRLWGARYCSATHRRAV